MKLSNIAIAAASASTVLAAPAVITEHVHASPTITVQGYIYFQDGVPYTSYTTIDDATNTQVTATPTLVANAVVEDSTTSTRTSTSTTTLTETTSSTPVAESTTSTTPAAATTTSTTPVAETSTSSTPVAETTTTSTPVAETTTTSTPVAETTTTSTQAATTTDSGLSDFANEILNAHNAKRALHQDTNALSWSSDLANYAQSYADNYDCSGTLTHSGGSYGENLAAGYDAAGAVVAWYDEISQYDFSNPAYSSATGHFTQLVWKSSTQVGCGYKQCNNEWGTYIICSYNPAGNFIGQFAENVGNLL